MLAPHHVPQPLLAQLGADFDQLAADLGQRVGKGLGGQVAVAKLFLDLTKALQRLPRPLREGYEELPATKIAP